MTPFLGLSKTKQSNYLSRRLVSMCFVVVTLAWVAGCGIMYVPGAVHGVWHGQIGSIHLFDDSGKMHQLRVLILESGPELPFPVAHEYRNRPILTNDNGEVDKFEKYPDGVAVIVDGRASNPRIIVDHAGNILSRVAGDRSDFVINVFGMQAD